MKALRKLMDRPIAFHRAFARIRTKDGARLGATAALMLSQAVYWQQRTSDPEGWWYKSMEDWKRETAMTRYEQETARRRLRQTDFWQEERRGIPARLYFRVDLEALARALEETSDDPGYADGEDEAGSDDASAGPPTGQPEPGQQVGWNPANKIAGIQQTRLLKTSKQDCWNPANKIAENQQTIPYITETTTEINTETTVGNKQILPSEESVSQATAQSCEEASDVTPTASPSQPEVPDTKHPAVGIYRHYVKRYPDARQRRAIVRLVRDLGRWRRVCERCLSRELKSADAILIAYLADELCELLEREGRRAGRFENHPALHARINTLRHLARTLEQPIVWDDRLMELVWLDIQSFRGAHAYWQEHDVLQAMEIAPPRHSHPRDHVSFYDIFEGHDATRSAA